LFPRKPEIRILVINPYGIGDVLFTTPVIRSIKEAYSASFIGYWCNQRVQPILRSNRFIDKVFPLSRGDLKRAFHASPVQGLSTFLHLLSSIKNEKFDLALDYSLDHRHGMICALCGIPHRIGYDYRNRGRFLTGGMVLPGYESAHMVTYHERLLSFLGCRPLGCGMELDVTCHGRKAAERMLAGIVREDRPLVGVAPGGGESWGNDAPLKRWPAAKFARLCDRISSELGCRVLLLGDRGEMAVCEKVKAFMRTPALDLSGRTSLDELSGVLQRLDLLVSNDGGILHMAAALGKKTVSFFGPVDPAVYGPYPPDPSRHAVLKKKLSCSPCYRDFRLAVCRRGKECLESIGVEEGFEAVAALISHKEEECRK
jgi:lipopolysaccharide heptosyltransferase II